MADNWTPEVWSAYMEWVAVTEEVSRNHKKRGMGMYTYPEECALRRAYDKYRKLERECISNTPTLKNKKEL